MTTPPSPKIDCERHHPCLTVPDIPAAIKFYTQKLGFTHAFTVGTPPTFAGVNLDAVQIFLSQGAANPQGYSLNFVVGNADDLYAFHRANGVEISAPTEDREYGLRDYSILDLNGYRLSFGHYIYNQGPPIPIERVDVPVRLEKRLAALLHDLAEHKPMSLTSCLEEILLHICEPTATASPAPTPSATSVTSNNSKRNTASTTTPTAATVS